MDEELKKAEELYLTGQIDKSLPIFEKLAQDGNGPVSYTHLTLPTTPYV